MIVKLLFTPDTGRVLGAQIVGGEGVDKRIDVLATAIQARADGLRAVRSGIWPTRPPYSSAKDPVNLAGYMAENLLTGKVCQIRFDDLAALPAATASRCWTRGPLRNMPPACRRV